MTELQEITMGKSLIELVRELKYQLEEMGETLFSPACSFKMLLNVNQVD